MPDLLTPERIEEIRARLERQYAVPMAGGLHHTDCAAMLADLAALLDHIAALEQAAEDDPPPADAALLASANRELVGRVERLERILAAEQGREGLPGWEYHNSGAWTMPGVTVERASHGWAWITASDFGGADTALEAMEAAEAAMRGER